MTKSQTVVRAGTLTSLVLAAPQWVIAADEKVGPVESGRVAWMLTSSALVLMMTAPGLALFYGGLVRKKNILGVMMQCVFLMGMMSVLWAICGYSLAFGGSNPYFGNFDHLLLRGVIASPELPLGEAAEKMMFATFQGMFFIIAPALICGAFAERMKFSAMCLYLGLWGLIVYCPIAHWVWAEPGWLCEWNRSASFPTFDFAGGTVVHISSGISALCCAILVGKRLGFGQEPMPPHNLTYTCVGAALLWVGWFGFNAGSALDANALAVNAFLATHLAASTGVLAWAAADWLHHGKPSILGACTGAVAGLVCITPAAGAVNPIQAMIVGLAGGVVSYYSCSTLKNTFRYDDSLDAFGVHGIAGIAGALLVGIFATRPVTGFTVESMEMARVGAIEGGMQQLVNQVVGVGAAVLWSIVWSFLLLKILDALIGLRVSQEAELQGLDLSQHGEEGYIFL